MTRLLSRPVLLSVTLHGVLLAVLLHVRYERGEPGAYHVIEVGWVRSGLGTAADGAADDGVAQPTDGDEEPPPAAPPEPETQVAEALATESPAAAPTPPAEEPPEPEPPEPTVAAAAEPPPEPRADPPAPEPASTPPPDAPLITASLEPEPAPPVPQPLPQTAEAPRPDDATTPAIAEPARRVDPAPAPQPLDARERRMLDRRIERWVRELPLAVADGAARVSWEHDGEEYTASFTALPAADDTGIDRVRVTVRTARSGEPVETEIELQRLAFSHFAQFVDRWDPNVQVHDDEIDGRFHSNSEIIVSSSRGVAPTFHGKVTTARDIDTSRSTGFVRRSEMFRGGLETRVGRIPLPPRFVPFETTPPADGDGVTTFAQDSRIVFYADGTFGFRPLDAPDADEQRRALGGDQPAYLIAADKVELHVSGIVNGKVLVYSPDDIVIVGNLTYAADPRRAGADDYLGLVSDAEVAIAPPDVTGPGDLTVHAAIYARSRFEVRGYRARGPATLALYGSLTAGSLSATEPRYRTRLEFDRRLENARPPSFPLTARYEVTGWDGAWRPAAATASDASVAEIERP